MDKEAIKKILPHREPMLLLDNIEINGQTGEGSYTVKGDEFFLQGHFPGMPLVPGVIQCEIMAQAGAVLALSMEGNEGKYPLFGGMDKVRFRKPVKPGDTFKVKCTITRMMGDAGFGEAQGYVDGELAASANVSFYLQKRS
jgi:3-hydroxyacyl-[acyl-carrier-protein] dehydratase